MEFSKEFNPICITGIGMVSSLGYNVRNACSAARAGISRVSEIDYFLIKSDEDGEEVSILGHQVPNATLGFEGFVRFLILARLALEDLKRNSSIESLEYSRIGIYLSLPDLNRVNQGLSLISNDEIRKSRLEALEGSPEGSDNTTYGVRICQALMSQLGLAIPSSNWFLFYDGHCGIAAVIKDAVRDLVNGKIDHAIIGGIDSLLEEETIQWLLDTERLKTDGFAAGLQPGEAGVFLLVEIYDTAYSRGAKILGNLVGLAQVNEENTLLSGDPSLGKGLSQTIIEAISMVGKEKCLPFWVISDQNGEGYRAYEWGNALIRLLPQNPELKESILWLPGIAFGDTGAASGFIAICMVICGFEHNYEESDVALILSSSDNEERAAILVAKNFF